MLTHNLGALYFDDVMSYNSLTTIHLIYFQKICPITRLAAKYFDPVTRHPYANLQAFKILREAYYSQLELKGDKNDPEVSYKVKIQ